MGQIIGTVRQPGSNAELACTYHPDRFFDVTDLAHAKRLTITREGDLTSELRWEVETKFVIDTLLALVALDASSWVLDYGCGVGRLAKALLQRVDCTVVGVDFSAKMRTLASAYVDHLRFTVCTSETLRESARKFDLAIAAWVLQHCIEPRFDVELIAQSLPPQSYLFLLNSFTRRIPIDTPADSSLCWMDDGVDVRALLARYFKPVRQGQFPVPQLAALNDWCYWALYQRSN